MVRQRRQPRPPRHRGRPLLAAAAAGLLLAWSAALPAAAETVEFTIGDRRIDESSGLATDTGGERYWTVNDSGDSGVAYALSPDGETEGTLEFRADPVDVEAVAWHQGRLYVADIGDNRERREQVSVYFFDDAAPGDGPVTYKSYDFSYPDGPHDAETLLVDGDGRLFVVTKGITGGIYAAPASPSRQGVNELERVGDAPAYVTDGTVLPDGRFALRTYVSVEIVDSATYEVVGRAATPAQPQGESITTTLDGSALLVGSEGRDSEVLRIDVPAEVGEAPSPQPSAPTADATPSAEEPAEEPTATETPAGEESAAADADPADTAAPLSRQGTLAALGLAVVVAAVAGAVVVLARRP